MIRHSSCLCHTELGELTNTYHHFQSRYVPSDSGYTYCNSLPDKKFFYWFGKSKLTSHPSHTLQMANQLTGYWSQARHVIMGVWVGGHTWKMTHPQAMEFFGVQKYFLLIIQNNIIEFQKHKKSGHPNEITFTAVIKMINMHFECAGGVGG